MNVYKTDTKVIQAMPLNRTGRKMKANDHAPASRRDARQTAEYLGRENTRLEIPMLHPDHIRYAAIIMRKLADQFDAIADTRAPKLDKIFDARVRVTAANEDLRSYARDEIEYVRCTRRSQR
tara:strand:+ start:352 stop:717 length:366 start_codon:yes stop_codon:yes gene_type:complete